MITSVTVTPNSDWSKIITDYESVNNSLKVIGEAMFTIEDADQYLADINDHVKATYAEAILNKYEIETYISAGLFGSILFATIFKAREKCSGENFAFSLIMTSGSDEEIHKQRSGIAQEKSYSKLLGHQLAVQTHQHIRMEELYTDILIQELAAHAFTRDKVQFDEESLKSTIYQISEILMQMDELGIKNGGNATDLLYFPKQGRIKISALEKVTRLIPGEKNNLSVLRKLLQYDLEIDQLDSFQKPDWMSEELFELVKSILSDEQLSAESIKHHPQLSGLHGIGVQLLI
ncbi:hypothetical protein D5R81_04565 [Parashewanella spongiae]|uniref:Uncharacterized protein n=2 Tax=Parashewanella spongiae TaxID=342950 RepID=A0A3A6TW48_9GAMM|nr:hypothetical protein D5R81_04565 [Parashewanella spongiae]